jgi:hypothetical protein
MVRTLEVCNGPLCGFALREAQILYLIYRRHGKLGTYWIVFRYMYQKRLLQPCLSMRGLVVFSNALRLRSAAPLLPALSTTLRLALTSLFEYNSQLYLFTIHQHDYSGAIHPSRNRTIYHPCPNILPMADCRAI